MTRWLRSRRAKRAALKGRVRYITATEGAMQPGEAATDEATLCVLRPWAAAWSAGHHDNGPLASCAGYTAGIRRRQLGG